MVQSALAGYSQSLQGIHGQACEFLFSIASHLLSVMIIREKRQLFQAFIMWDHFLGGRRSVFEWVSVKAVGIRYHADRPCWCNLFPRNFCASCGRASRISDLLLSSFRRLFHTSSRTRYALRLLLLQFFPNFPFDLAFGRMGTRFKSKMFTLRSWLVCWPSGGVKSSAGSFFCSASPSQRQAVRQPGC